MERPCKRTKSDHDSLLDTNTKETDHIPMDIVKEILQRLPAKSVAKFVRLSKPWATIISSNYFINSFSLQQSMATQPESHRLLFAVIEDNWSFFSSSSVNLAPKKPPQFICRMFSQFDRRLRCGLPIIYVNGLLSLTCRRSQVICNPTTGKSIVLPLVKTRRRILRRYFGFDPIKSEYKVLCIIGPMHSRDGRITPSQNQVLTVGSKNLWRKLDFWIHHNPISKSICIDGIIYYLAREVLGSSSSIILVRFDVKSEKFLKQLPCLFLQPLGLSLTLINYESKLGIGHRTNPYAIDLWVLEDSEKVRSKISLNVSPEWFLNIRYDIQIMGTTPSGEIVYTCDGRKNGFYVIYHDHKKNQHRRIEIKPNIGPAYKRHMLRICFNDYVESVMFL